MRRTRSKTHEAASVGRMDRQMKEHEGDAYGLRGKLPDPTACPRCGAIYRAGRWAWGAPPADAHRTECPACRRTSDGVPAGIVTVKGAFAAEHRDEIVNLVRNVEEREKAEHALKRVMALAPQDDGALEISTTDARLARAIADALHSAYRGELDYQFVEPESCFRATWVR
jgi:NMD protein affecting ribosome stability and mRNA decay